MALHDLTRPIEDGMATYPDDPSVAVSPHARMDADGYRVSELRLGTHAGTHVDAPSHVLAGGASLGEFDPEAFRFDAHVVDVSDLGARAEIPAEAVPATTADLVLFYTGWAAHWGTDRYRAHPYLSRRAAERCAGRGLAVGLDCFGPDPTPLAPGFVVETDRDDDAEPDLDGYGTPAHRALLEKGCLILENLVELDGLPERCSVTAHPLSVDADGAPARVVAETGE
ncbi:cyclase family protein [Halorarum halobium]|uniref:cyclase family protein n=1 Tax=Halorarum halobium TaxID=3075121 RepID=UPI0028B04E11|nr:cyclase family protein [Halobaculum sp. XH14]